MTLVLVRDVQERAARATPPAYLRRLDRWWLRHGGGSAWWASSVLPHADVETAELTARIRRVEAFYADRGSPVRFQISPGTGPADLDGTLAGRGYRVQSPMSLRSALVADVIDRTPTGARHIDLSNQPTDAWFQTWRSIHGTGGDRTGPRHAASRGTSERICLRGGRR